MRNSFEHGEHVASGNYQSEIARAAIDFTDIEETPTAEKVRPLTPDAKWLLKPILHQVAIKDKPYIEQLDAADTDFLHDIFEDVIDGVYGDERYISDGILPGREFAGRSIGKDFVQEVGFMVVDGVSIVDVAKIKKMRVAVIRDKLDTFRGLVGWKINTDGVLEATVTKKCREWDRKKEDSSRQKEIAERIKDTELPKTVGKMLRERKVSEAEYYAFGYHVGTVVFKNVAPVGDSPEEKANRLKREYATSEAALQSALRKITDAYQMRSVEASRLNNDTLALDVEPRLLLSLIIGDKPNGREPIPRSLLKEKYRQISIRNGLQPLNDTEIDHNIAHSLEWVFDLSEPSEQ